MTPSLQDFKQDILQGLKNTPIKTLPSKYFYDNIGSQYFEKIMALPEYYLTNCEAEILDTQSLEILKNLPLNLQVVELGSGNGKKVISLIQKGLKNNQVTSYVPIDISKYILNKNQKQLQTIFPQLEINPQWGTYFEVLNKLQKSSQRTSNQLFLFLGSNIGNFKPNLAENFLTKVSTYLNPNSYLLVGFDLKKNPQIILDAYNDSQKITQKFNLNLLTRINRELNGNFDLDQFKHFPTYNPLTGTTASFLVSQKKQTVQIDGQSIHFKNGEVIHSEISQKYSLDEIETLGKRSHLKQICSFLDTKQYYALVLFQKQS